MKNLNKIILGLLTLSIIFISCDKYDVNEGITSQEATLIKLPQATVPVYSFALDAAPGDLKLGVLKIVRDAISEAELQKPLTVRVMLDQAGLDSFNAHSTSDLTLFTAYTNDPETPFDGTGWTVNFAPGEFVKFINITFDPTQMDLSVRNTIPFKISSADGARVSSLSSALVEVAVKNAYDGIYSVESGNVQRYTAPGSPEVGPLNGSLAGNPDVSLITTGANTVQVSGLQWANKQGGVGGVDPLRATVDPSTSLVTMSSGVNATLGNWDGHINDYDLVTKTFRLAFRWNPTANIREYEVVLKYKGPR